MGIHKRFDSDGEEAVEDPKSKPQIPLPTNKISKPQPRHLRKGRQQKSIRGQIRSIQRLIKNRGSQLAPNALNNKKKELEELIRLRDEHDRRENERKIAQEYRMLKFIEKRKLQRVLDKIIQHGDKPEDAERKKQIMRDLRYIEEYPKDKKYVALFPSGGHTEKSRAKVEAIRAEIEGTASGKTVDGTSRDMDGGTDAVKADEAPNENQDDFFLEEA